MTANKLIHKCSREECVHVINIRDPELNVNK